MAHAGSNTRGGDKINAKVFQKPAGDEGKYTGVDIGVHHKYCMVYLWFMERERERDIDHSFHVAYESTYGFI